jgi:hypothetical protein
MATYIQKKIRQYPKTFVAAYPDNIVTSISPYLPKTLFYFPQSNRWGTYSIWNNKWDIDSFDTDIIQNIAALPSTHPGYEQYYYLCINPLPIDSIKFYHIEQLTQMTDPYLAKLSHPWKTYYLYHLETNREPVLKK